MQTPRRYAVFGVLDDSTALLVRPLQEQITARTGNDLARRFPVHVTLRGRFWGLPAAVSEAFQQAGREGWTKCDLKLSGPAFQPPNLLWLSVELDGTGYSELLRLHKQLEVALKPVLRLDETLPAHAGTGYQPHVTLAWGATEEAVHLWGLPEIHSAHAKLAGVVLAEYPDAWPTSGTVRLVGRWDPPKSEN
jgi:hypothetical protein